MNMLACLFFSLFTATTFRPGDTATIRGGCYQEPPLLNIAEAHTMDPAKAKVLWLQFVLQGDCFDEMVPIKIFLQEKISDSFKFPDAKVSLWRSVNEAGRTLYVLLRDRSGDHPYESYEACI